MKLTLFAVLSGSRTHCKAVCEWANHFSKNHEVTLMSPTWVRPRRLQTAVNFQGLGFQWKRRFQQLNFSDCVVYFFRGSAKSIRTVYQHANIHPGICVLSCEDPLAIYRSWFSREAHFLESFKALEALTYRKGAEAVRCLWTRRSRGALSVDDLGDLLGAEACQRLFEEIAPTREACFVDRFAKRMALRVHTDFREPTLVDPLVDRLASEVNTWFPK